MTDGVYFGCRRRSFYWMSEAVSDVEDDRFIGCRKRCRMSKTIVFWMSKTIVLFWCRKRLLKTIIVDFGCRKRCRMVPEVKKMIQRCFILFSEWCYFCLLNGVILFAEWCFFCTK
ncbi:hypothetical protein Hdeb2414_s0017g00502591 [Helianthus debilis subsp. tardiflorus]